MAALFRRNRIFCTQLKQLHRTLSRSSVPTIEMNMERKAFLSVLPEVINSVVTGPKIKEMPELQSWIKKILEYMLGSGKLGRGLMVSIGYRMFEEPENYSEETQHSARILGWCVEMMQSTFLILDDIVDNATVRRGKPCWHLQRCVGLYGVNDSLILYQSMLELLDIYFGQTPIYGDLLKYYNEAVYRATMGEHLDLWTTYRKEKNNLDLFNGNFINSIASNKTAYYSCKLPIFVPLLLAKNGKKQATEELSNICMEFGRLLQIQDDYIDVYGDQIVTGKSGRDIQEGKCTWVAVTALEQSNETQRAIFKEYYGSKNPEHVKRIKQLCDELHIPKLYEECERTIYEDLVRRIKALPHERDKLMIKELEDKLETLERKTRGVVIEIRNIPKQNGETKDTLVSVISKLGEILNVGINTNNIKDIYRLKSKDSSDPIVVDFTSVLMKDKVLKSVKTFNKIKQKGKK